MADDTWLNADGEVEKGAQLAAQIRDEIWRHTRHLAGLLGETPPSTPNAMRPTSPAARRIHLLHLQVATAYAEAGQRIAQEAAERAGRAGAGFPELGEAAGISRQAARKRWPTAAGTIWRTHFLGGRPGARKVSTASARSREQAVSRAQYAVQRSLSHTDGDVAAVVTDSTGAVVLAYVADHELYDAAEVVLPEHLAAMPKDADSPERNTWMDNWQAFVDKELRRRGGTP
ncbi:hypothetical protein ACFY00_30830 [Kitasatospora sp. NPDC001540]|uniref:hypothetical protein n=1 Tax=Kitasatospora sp. NPDC001540 TaxID=3364014 RepID=UPI0036796170